ncbi:hypothetical protein OIO90_005072 [Microbotryomycetes sp. JL221]|nr:hypothetical protein OIO90_005072 [Microbotryomycetes sp. JL221]
MSNDDSNNIYFGPPDGYTTPEWPALYNPVTAPQYLYTPGAIWRFVLFWTMVLYAAVFFIMGVWCMTVFIKRHPRLALLAPLIFTTVGLMIAFVSATVVGYCLAALYNAAFLRMSTYTPALWAVLQLLILLYFSLTTQSKFVG